MLEESEIIMKFTNFLSNDTGESTKHFNLDASGFKSLPELEYSVRDLRDYLTKMFNEAPEKAKALAAAIAPVTRAPRMEQSVNLTNFGNRIQALADMCKDNNTDLESACISVQRSGVGFVNPRVKGTRPQKMPQQEPQSLPVQQPHDVTLQQHLPFPQQPFSPQPMQNPVQPLLADLSASTQAVMQLANLKMMQKLVDAINRMGNSGRIASESSEQTTEDDSGPDEPNIPSEPPSSRRPLSSVSRSSSQRPPSAVSLRSSSRPSSAISMKSGPDVMGKISHETNIGAAAQRPFSASGFLLNDEARSRGARYMQ